MKILEKMKAHKKEIVSVMLVIGGIVTGVVISALSKEPTPELLEGDVIESYPILEEVVSTEEE